MCNGDSGGSLTLEENGVYRFRGIVSLTVAKDNGLCNPMEYVIFTDVVKYLSWIIEIVPELEESKKGNFKNKFIPHDNHVSQKLFSILTRVKKNC